MLQHCSLSGESSRLSWGAAEPPAAIELGGCKSRWQQPCFGAARGSLQLTAAAFRKQPRSQRDVLNKALVTHALGERCKAACPLSLFPTGEVYPRLDACGRGTP